MKSRAWPNSIRTYHDMTVNAYLVWDPATREAVAFDTGADCGGMLHANRRRII